MMRRSTALFVASGCVLLTAALPLILVKTAAVVSNLAGCSLDQGFASSCRVLGAELGPTLVEMSWAGMALALTIWYVPVAIGLALWGFAVQMRSKGNSSQDPPVSSALWAICAAVLLSPYAWKTSAALTAVTVYIEWRNGR
jgi:hypothetical protein